MDSLIMHGQYNFRKSVYVFYTLFQVYQSHLSNAS